MAISVLVFGATGAVGSACARHAHSLGATVTLAVRDTNKPIPGLSLEQEKAAGYKRAQADLTKPETITEAVAQSGAKHAFVYLVHAPGAPDANRAALKALKAAGVEFVVFLSSFTVAPYEPSIDSIPAEEYIPYAHAQVELALRDVFGSSYVALRPGGFVSNTLRWASQFKSGVVKMPHPEAKFDWIVREDIGRAGGTILAGGPSSTGGKTDVLLCGPKLITQGDAAHIIGKVVGKEVDAGAYREAPDQIPGQRVCSLLGERRVQCGGGECEEIRWEGDHVGGVGDGKQRGLCVSIIYCIRETRVLACQCVRISSPQAALFTIPR